MIAATAICSMQVAGQNCKYRTNGIDEFTKARKVITASPIGLSSALNDRIWYKRVDNSYSLHLHVATTDIQSIKDGATAMFKFANDSVVTLVSINDVISEFEVTSVATIMWIEPAYEISREQLQLFSTVPLARVRLVFANGYVDYDPTQVLPARARKVMEAARCLLEAD